MDKETAAQFKDEINQIPTAGMPDKNTQNALSTVSDTSTMNTQGISTNTETPEEHMDKPAPLPPETYQTESAVEPVPVQNQLPVDTYLYANTSSIGGVIQSTAEQYNLDPHKLEALTNTIRNRKANLSGFYNMQISYYPGMSAESLVTQLGRVADLSNTITEKENQEARLKGLQPTSNGLDKLIDSLQSIDGKQAGKYYYQEALNALQEADHIKFDNQTLSRYYETLIQSGMSKADAWTHTMRAQDEYRAAQDKRAVMQDANSIINPDDMSAYAANLYNKVQNTKDADTKIRLYGQYQVATQLAKQFAEAFKSDPAAYLQSKDPTFKSILAEASKTGNYASVITNMDKRYDEMGVPQSQRKYLRSDQAKVTADEINTFMASDPSKAQAVLTNLNKTYGQNAGKVINQLIADNKVQPEAKVLIEAIKTHSPVSNEDVLTMMKYKMAYKGDFLKEMLNAPDKTTANTLRTKLEARIYDLPGYKALVNQLNLNGNVKGKIEMAQYYADMAAFYKYKNPGLSDKRAVEKVQTNLIDSIYTYDASHRVILPHRTLDGKTLLYGKYNAPQAKNYLANRSFTNQHLRIGMIPLKTSERMLQDTNKIFYRTIDQNTVQPVYDDGNGVVQALYKVDKNGNPYKDAKGRNIPYTINLKHLGEENVIGVFNARDALRSLVNTLYKAANIPDVTSSMVAGRPLNRNTMNAQQTLENLGFDLKHLDTTKSWNQQFDRSKMEPRRIQALNNLVIKQNQFDLELEKYRKLQHSQRSTVAYQTMQMVKPFLEDFMLHPASQEKSKLYAWQKTYKAEQAENLPELKQSRQALYKLEAEIMQEAAIFLNYKGTLPKHPLMDKIQYHGLTDKILWGGY